MRRFILLAAVPILFALVGCGNDGPRIDTPIEDIPVELKQVNTAKLDEALASYKGRIVVVDCWFLGCRPCVEKFPEFVEMRAELAKEGIACLSLDVMPSEAASSDKVLGFLKKQNAAFPNYLLNDTEAKTDLWLERNQVIGTPATLVYDRKGELLRNLEDAKAEKVKKYAREAAKK